MGASKGFVNLALAMSAVLLLGISGAAMALVVLPWTHARSAARFVRTPCVITAAQEHDGTWTYEYRYRADGAERSGDRASFWAVGTRDRLRVDEATSCWVDPADPAYAVLSPRDEPPSALIAVLGAAGAAAIAGVVRFGLVRLNLIRVRASVMGGERRFYRELD